MGVRVPPSAVENKTKKTAAGPQSEARRLFLSIRGDVAALVEGGEDAAVGGRGVAGDQAAHPEGVDGLDVAAGVVPSAYVD